MAGNANVSPTKAKAVAACTAVADDADVSRIAKAAAAYAAVAGDAGVSRTAKAAAAWTAASIEPSSSCPVASIDPRPRCPAACAAGTAAADS